jgi:hypothetical protein
MSEWGELLDALRQESLEADAGPERALAAWLEEGEQRCIDGQLVCVHEKPSSSPFTRRAPPPPPMRTWCPSGAVTLGSIS